MSLICAPWARDTEAPRPRVRALKITGELLLDLFKEGIHRGFYARKNALPDDAKLVHAGLNYRMDLVLIVESNQWPELLGGQGIPDHPDIMFVAFNSSYEECLADIESGKCPMPPEWFTDASRMP